MGCSKAPPLPCPFPQPPADALQQDAVMPAGVGSPAWAATSVPGSTAAPPPWPNPGHPDTHPAWGHPPRHVPAQPQHPRSPSAPRSLQSSGGTHRRGPLMGQGLGGAGGDWGGF